MANWKYIATIIFVLVGGFLVFGYWVVGQFNLVFDNLDFSYLAHTYSAYKTTDLDTGLASSSPDMDTASSTDLRLVSTSTDITTDISEDAATSTVPVLSFIFPHSGTQVFMGCTYPISWESNTPISSLGAILVDAGTREVMGPKTGGLAKENIIGKNSSELNWKVGSVWPGAYYIKVSRINGDEAEFRSKTFQINKMPDGADEEEQKNLCEETRGNLF